VHARYQLIAIDLDGTLLDSRGKLPARNRAALHRAHDNGLKVVLCTGRSYTETRPVIQQIGLDLDATITVGGALITDVASGATLEATPMEPQLARECAAWFQSRGYALLWLHDRHAAGDDGFAIDGPRRHAAIDLWLMKSGCSMRAAAGIPAFDHNPLRLTILDDDAELRRMSAELAAEFDERLTHNLIHVPAYGFTVIESFAGVVSKWFGIESLCRRWNIDPAATVAVGDDVNDLSMIRTAGLGVAVANARPEVLAASKRQTASNNDAGVADLIDTILSNNTGLAGK
jgi:hydroxymethylpyrimidine pyrophosphatase-like HAD family hydrolase